MGSCSVHRPPINSDKTLSRVAGGEPRSMTCRQQWLLHSTMAGRSAKRTATATIVGRLGASKCTIFDASIDMDGCALTRSMHAR
eukprot:COSAG02_NODE_6222_length_3716_cov_741.328449_2_plen_84_part_00